LVWRESGLVDRLPAGTLPRVWSTPIAEGYSGPAVANGRVFVTDRVHGEGAHGVERVLCLDAATGKELWKFSYDCDYTISYPAGPRATPVIDDGRVYTLGAVGHLFCFEADSGKVLWQKHFPADFGTVLPTWGMAASPLVEGEQLITLVGGPGALVVSFDKRTGRELWRALDDAAVGYCPPVIFDFGQSRQLIQWHPAAVSSLDPQTGRVNWQVPFPAQAGLTISTPRQLGQRLFVTAFYNGPLMLSVRPDASGADVLWKGKSESEINTDGLHAIMATPLMDDTHLYGVCSYGQLRCLDAVTGTRLWETEQATGSGRWWNAFLIPHEPRGEPSPETGHRVFIANEQGELILARLTPEGYEEQSRSMLIEPTRPLARQRVVVWSHPAFAERSVFARNDREIVRVSLARD
ncbi:MAG: PQQ-like beta-propeller repeat protein, partial [Planctomycetaceae bacterium]|nr:PQQ-like beta-propeller repeat protein [Planctomycetaceae bacterium]